MPERIMGNSADERRRARCTQRMIHAPCTAVFEAFRDPARLGRWWGPEGFSSTFTEFEFHSRGHWRFTMHGPDGTAYPNESVFREMIPGQRMVIEHFSDHHCLS